MTASSPKGSAKAKASLDGGGDPTPDVIELRQDIAQHRQELAATVDQLAAKLDVKTKAKAKAQELKPVLASAAAGLAGLVLLVTVVKKRKSRKGRKHR